jgi:hypothetical protein
MQNESEPLGERKRLEHHEQRQSYRIGQKRLVLGVDPIPAAHDRVGQARPEAPPGDLAPRGARAQHVEAHPRHDRGEPSPKVLDAADVGATEP